jgi:WD40 repeat protein
MSGRLLWTALLALAAGPAALAQPLAPGPARTDRYGDPLPAGAVARLGTARLCQQGAGSLAFAPDGKTLAAMDDFGDLILWEVATGKELRRLPPLPPNFPPSPAGPQLAFAPDSKLLAVGGFDKALHLFEVATGRLVHTLRLAERANSLAFSPDGRLLASAEPSGTVRLWDVAGGKQARTWAAPAPLTTATLNDVAFAAGGKVVVTLSVDDKAATVCAWDAATGARRQRGRFNGATNAALSPDGRRVAVWPDDGRALRLMDAVTGKELGRAEGDAAVGAGVVFSGDGRAMTAASRDGVVRVWDTERCRLRHCFRALSTSIPVVALSADGRLVALTGRADAVLHIWDVAGGKELHAFAGHRGGPLAVVFSPDGRTVLTANGDWTGAYGAREWADWSLCRWDAATGKLLAQTRAKVEGEVTFVTFSADARGLATVTHEGTLRLWDTAAGREVWRAKVETRPVVVHEGARTREAPALVISAPAFSPSGQTLFVPGLTAVRRWATATGKELPALKLPERSGAQCLAIGDDAAVVNINPAGWVVLLDAAAREGGPRGFGGRGNAMRTIALSPDGQTLAAAKPEHVRLWEVGSRQERGRFEVPATKPIAFSAEVLAFSPDGRVLAGADDQGAIRLWDLSARRALRGLPAAGAAPAEHKVGNVTFGRTRRVALAFSPDGGRLAVADENTVLIWDVADRTLPKARPARLSPEQLEVLWQALEGADAAAADRAIWELADAGPAGAAYVKRRLGGGGTPTAELVARLVVGLDSEEFKVREQASAELGKLGRRAEPALRKALAAQPSTEARRRINQLLARLGEGGGEPPSPALIARRAVEALEKSRAAEARQVLAELARGAPGEPLTRDAKAALERLARRAPAR